MDDDDRWAAVLGRDEAADGTFVYGVTSTGIYCRPSCPSRRPRRAHVVLLDGASQARAMGLRPCRRCDPDGAGPADRRRALVARACRAIEAAPEPLTLAQLAQIVGGSPDHLRRQFVAVTGITPKAFGDAVRAARAASALGDAPTVLDALHAAGYGSAARFYAAADDRLGMSPSQHRSGGRGVHVDWATAACSLGWVLVATTEVGICAISLGDDPDELASELADRFPAAVLTHAPDGLVRHVEAVLAAVDDPALGADLPLDLAGTAFQQRVWAALREVPAGATTSYGELAVTVGAPTGARAVAGACAANPAAIGVPCHRVVRADGSLAGYRWGTTRKAALLEREAARRSEAPAGAAVTD